MMNSQASGAGGEEESMEVREEEEEREWVSVLGLRRRCGVGEESRNGWSTEYGEDGAEAAASGGDRGGGGGDGSAGLWGRSMAASCDRGRALLRCCSVELIFFARQFRGGELGPLPNFFIFNLFVIFEK